MKKKLDKAKGEWAEELLRILWAFRITSYLGRHETLFNLAFDTNAIIPVEIKINSIWVAHFDPEQNESNLWANLNLLEEIREDASVKVAAKQRWVTQYYNKWVKVRTFEEGYFVLRTAKPVNQSGNTESYPLRGKIFIL